MELKGYQKKTLEEVKRYLESLVRFKITNPKYFQLEDMMVHGLSLMNIIQLIIIIA